MALSTLGQDSTTKDYDFIKANEPAVRVQQDVAPNYSTQVTQPYLEISRSLPEGAVIL
jgi:hypothetical protein